jgi:hypothetical protein
VLLQFAVRQDFLGLLFFWGQSDEVLTPKPEMRSRLLSGPISISRVCVFPCLFFSSTPCVHLVFFFPCLKQKISRLVFAL